MKRSTVVRVVMLACGALVLVVPSALARRPPDVVTTAATDVGSSSATFNGVVTPHGIDTTYFFQYGTHRFDAHTPLASAGDGREPVAVSVPVANLSPDTAYRVRLIAFNPDRISTGDDVAFATRAAEPLAGPAPAAFLPLAQAPSVLVAPPPVLGERVNVAVRTGTVTLKVPGGDDFVPLSEFASVPVGSLVNTRRGSVRLRSARASGGTQAGIFHGGLFEVRQSATAGMTELALRGRGARCGAGSRSDAAATARRRKRRRALWGSVRHGNFRTRGGYSVATVRGTVWYVEDRCDGTLTRVRRGSVRVRDLRRHRTVVVRAGNSYLARAKR
jgi:hypothetical protein